METIDFNNKLLEYKEALKGFAYSLTRNSDDAFDLLQETYLKALTYKESYTTQSNFKAWLMTIMRNTFINAYNRNIKGIAIMNEMKALYPTYTNNTEMRLGVSELNAAIDRLKEEYKMPLRRFIEGFKYDEIAREFKIPIGTVKSRIFMARSKVTESIKEKPYVQNV